MIRLDAGTVLLQWAVGGWLFLWVTTRHREVGLGYGWLMRAVYVLIALVGVGAGLALEPIVVRDVAALLAAAASMGALVSSIVRRRAGVAGQQVEHDRRSARVAAMTGIDRHVDERQRPTDAREFDPRLDLLAPLIGTVGLVAAALDAAPGGTGDAVVAVLRTLVGAAFLGVVTDAMLLGHWYLVQPGLARKHLLEQVRWLGLVTPIEVAVLLLPTGMLSVLSGSVDDGWDGTLGWMWVACAVTTGALALVTMAALKERAYSAVMAATGLLYLAILTAFGTDLVARAVLS